MSATFRVHTQIKSAEVVKAIDEVLISKRWNETSKQSAKERAICVPMEVVSAPEVPYSFRVLVEAVLRNQAVELLKKFCDENPNSFEIPAGIFTRVSLTEDFLSSGEFWLSKSQLDASFSNSATWKRICSKPEFLSNQTYKNAANAFKETILKLSGKNVQIPADKCDAIISKLEETDLESDFGTFVVRRLTQIREKVSTEIDFDSL